VYQYQYDVDLSTNSSLDPGDFFVFYDVTGFIGATTAFEPVGVAWNVTTQNVGPNPSPTVGPAVDTGTTNVIFTFAGPVSVFNASGSVSIDLGQFNINSSVPVVNMSLVGGQNSGASTPGSISQGIQSVGGPATPEVPEPATMGLVGGAFLGLGMLARRRK
jgi:hypothetical protein